MTQEELFKNIISHCKEYGFVFPSSEIYDNLGAVYDYGPYGVELKNNIREYWWKAMVQMNDNIVGLDASIFMHPMVWKASGHVDAFSDPLIDNKDSKKRYRADVLIEEHIAKIEAKIDKEVEKAKKRFENFDEKMYRETNARVVEYQKKIDEINTRFKNALEKNDLAEVKQIIVDCEIVCPVSGTKNWTDVRQFNLMFSTQMGSVAEDTNTIYLRPETAQGIFVNFLNVQRSARMKIPFGIAQTGKAFRNEIVARQFLFRMREFEQMEMQFFVRPGEEMQWYNTWKEKRLKWHHAMGLGADKYRFHDHIKLAHYANAACDIEFNFPFGFKEIEGIHSRTDFDLSSHEKFSGKKLQYFDSELNKNYVPYVIETSIGLDRMFLALLSVAFTVEKVDSDSPSRSASAEQGKTEGESSERIVLRIHPALAPVKVAVFPLIKKDGLPEKAMEIFNNLKTICRCYYEEKDTIGKRYRRQDAIGTPFCITIDYETLKDNCVTLRHRDTMQQERIPIDKVAQIVEEKVSLKNLLTQSA